MLSACKKEDTNSYDYRDVVIGDFNGIKVHSYWKDTVVGYGHDTTSIQVSLAKSESDSVIDIRFDPGYSSGSFSFKYIGGEFYSTTNYHPPVLELTNDSLYYYHKAGLGPSWTECFCLKSE